MALKGPVRPVLSLEVTGQRQEHVAGEVPLPRYSIGPLQEKGWDTGCHVHFACGHDRTAAGMWLGHVPGEAERPAGVTWCRRPCAGDFTLLRGKITRKSKHCWFPA